MKPKITLLTICFVLFLSVKSYSQTDSISYYQLKVIEQIRLGNNSYTANFFDGHKWVLVLNENKEKFTSEMEPLNDICTKLNLKLAFYSVSQESSSDLVVHRFILAKKE